MSTDTPTEMTILREDLNPCTVKLTVTCTSTQVKSGVKKAIKALSKRIKVPGFRPGTAPSEVIEKMVSPQEVEAHAQEETINATFKKVLESESLEIGGQAQIEDVQFDREAYGCVYTVKVPLVPQVEIGEYKGLQAEKFKVEVKDEDIDRQIDELRSRGGKKKAIEDRGITTGDGALVNIKVDEEEGDGRNFMIVAGQTFEDLDKALDGMEIDGIKAVELNFPDTFEEADLAGKKLKTSITVRSISAIELPEVDDEFAKSLQLENVDDLKSRISENISQAKSNMAQEMVNERLMELVQANSTIHVADTTWEGVAERRIEDIKKELAEQKSDIADYAKQNGMSEEEFMAAQRTEARIQVERAVLIENIFKGEGMQVTEQDANDQFLKIAYENRIPEDGIKKFAKEFGPQIRDEVVYRTMFSKVMALLNEHADITEIDAPDGPVPA